MLETSPTPRSKRAAEPDSSASRDNSAKKAARTAGGGEKKTLEQHRRALGDSVKAAIHVEKWCIKAQTHCETECPLHVFQELVVPNAVEVMPASFCATTPVVVALVEGHDSAAQIFGKTKITGGTRMGSWTADKMEIVYFPATSAMRIWWTMK